MLTMSTSYQQQPKLGSKVTCNMYLAQQLETVSTCKPNNVSVQDKHIHKRYDSESITISNYTQIHDDIPLYY